jgi:hypothetical protein
MQEISYQLINLASSFPVLLVLVGAGAISLFRMTQDPQRTAKVLVAIGILLFVRFAFPFLTPLLLNSGGVEMIQVRILLNGLMYSVPTSIAYALLFWAILDGRPSRSRGQFPGDSFTPPA